jgi:hypothetical protein
MKHSLCAYPFRLSSSHRLSVLAAPAYHWCGPKTYRNRQPGVRLAPRFVRLYNGGTSPFPSCCASWRKEYG